MHKFASFNNEITDASKIQLPAVSTAVFYGRGIFTTVAIYNSQPFQWVKHWRRLNGSAKAIGIDLPEIKEDQIARALSEIISINRIKSGRARISIFDQKQGGVWQIENSAETAFLITTADFRSFPNDLRMNVSPYPVNSKSPLAGIKSSNYLENLLSFEKAKKNGFDEAIRLNEKSETVSATMANVFWTRNKEIFTPSLETGALAGTTRAFVLENFRVREKTVSLEKLKDADEVFLTSAGLGIARVKEFEGRELKSSIAFSVILDSFNEFINKSS